MTAIQSLLNSLLNRGTRAGALKGWVTRRQGLIKHHSAMAKQMRAAGHDHIAENHEKTAALHESKLKAQYPQVPTGKASGQLLLADKSKPAVEFNSGTHRVSLEAKKGDGSGISLHTDPDHRHNRVDGDGRKTRNAYTDNLKPDGVKWGKYGSGKRTDHYDLPQGIYEHHGRGGGHVMIHQDDKGNLKQEWIDSNWADKIRKLVHEDGMDYHEAIKAG